MDESAVQTAMQQALADFMGDHPEILDATVTLMGEDNEVRVQIVLRSDSYGAAEDLMTAVGPLLTAAVEGNSAAPSVRRGATELVPA